MSQHDYVIDNGAAAVVQSRLDAIMLRLSAIEDTIEALTPAGHGVGSFYLTYPAHAPRVDTTRVRPMRANQSNGPAG